MIITVSSLLHSQDRDVFAPFVSRLKVTSQEKSITITWKDCEDVEGACIIYRYTDEITSTNFSSADQIAEVPAGKEIFIDYPNDVQKYYYAVLVKDSSGKVYELFIPFRNKSITGIAAASVADTKEIAARITGIKSRKEEDAILVTFTSSNPDRELIIYRSTSPIKNRNDLVYAQPLRTIPSSQKSFKDFPVPGIPYYYAIFDSSLIKIGEISITPGSNATLTPSEIALGSRVGLPESIISRPLPLPLLHISKTIETGKDLSRTTMPLSDTTQQLSPSTVKAVNALLEKIPDRGQPDLEPDVLPEDKDIETAGGEQYTLLSILYTEFAEKRWRENEILLNNFLSVHHSEDIEIRSHYYLGQVYFFQGKYKNAFMEFLLAQNSLYSETKPWMDAIFELL